MYRTSTRSWLAAVSVAALVIGSAVAQTAPPRLESVRPVGGQRGTSVVVTFSGVNIGIGTGLLIDGEGVTVEAVTPDPPLPSPAPVKEGEKPPAPPKNPSGKMTATLRIAPDAAPGIRPLRVLTPLGPSDIGSFAIGFCPELEETEPNNLRANAPLLKLPVTLNGRLDPEEDLDQFRFTARKGQTVVAEVAASRLGSALDSIMSIQDATGREVALNEDANDRDSLLLFTAPSDGEYLLTLRDLQYRGGANHVYRLTVGELPFVTGLYPAGGRAGETLSISATGYNLDRVETSGVSGSKSVSVALPMETEPGQVKRSLTFPTGVVNPVTLAVGDLPEVFETEPNDARDAAQKVSLPVTLNGRIGGERAAVSGAGTGAESPPTAPDADLYRISLAKGDKVVLEVAARRLGSPLDSMLAVLDADGKELASNDDTTGKDSRLEFTAPEAADYLVRVTDLQERSGPEFSYRLSAAPAAPGYRLSFVPDRVVVARGGRIPLTVNAERLNGFDGEIALDLAGLPKGVSIVGAPKLAAGKSAAHLVLVAEKDAAIGADRFSLSGTATLGEKTTSRRSEGMEEYVQDGERRTRPSQLFVAAVAEAPDIVVSLGSATLALAPGGSVELPVTIARKEGFTARVPLSVLGLPQGVTVEGQIEENKSEGKLTLKAQAQPGMGDASIIVVADVTFDGNRRVAHAAAPITLTVQAAEEKKAP